MNDETLDSTEQDDVINYKPMQSLIGHHLLDKDSFTNSSKIYMIVTPIAVMIMLLAFNLGNFAIMVSKMNLVPYDELIFSTFKESIYFGILLTTIPQILLWSLIVHGLMVFLGGKGKILKSISIYLISQTPILIGLFILTIVALSHSKLAIYPYSFPIFGSIMIENKITRMSFDIYQIFNTSFSNYALANNILVPITNFYSALMVGFGLSAEHKVPLLIGLFVSGLAFVATMIFYFVI